jgi:hypothetical protein
MYYGAPDWGLTDWFVRDITLEVCIVRFRQRWNTKMRQLVKIPLGIILTFAMLAQPLAALAGGPGPSGSGGGSGTSGSSGGGGPGPSGVDTRQVRSGSGGDGGGGGSSGGPGGGGSDTSGGGGGGSSGGPGGTSGGPGGGGGSSAVSASLDVAIRGVDFSRPGATSDQRVHSFVNFNDRF